MTELIKIFQKVHNFNRFWCVYNIYNLSMLDEFVLIVLYFKSINMICVYSVLGRTLKVKVYT